MCTMAAREWSKSRRRCSSGSGPEERCMKCLRSQERNGITATEVFDCTICVCACVRVRVRVCVCVRARGPSAHWAGGAGCGPDLRIEAPPGQHVGAVHECV